MYEGQFAADKQHGWGRIRYPDGREYEGCFVENRREGHGVMKYVDGRKEEGICQNNILTEACEIAAGLETDIIDDGLRENIRLRMPQGPVGAHGSWAEEGLDPNECGSPPRSRSATPAPSPR